MALTSQVYGIENELKRARGGSQCCLVLYAITPYRVSQTNHSYLSDILYEPSLLT